MAKVTLKIEGQRIYFEGDTFAHKQQIKSMGGHWDEGRRAWWVGKKKLPDAEKLVSESTNPAHVREAAESVGLRVDTPAEIVADKIREEQGDKAADAILAKPQEDPHSIRLTGKGRYKGRDYYAGSITRDGMKVRLLTLPDADGKYLDFWAPCAEVEEIKRYKAREAWDGRRNSGRTVTVYTTLGSIADFVAKQKAGEKAGIPACAECGKRNPHLIIDLEDGLMKCRSCCDIPSE